MIRWLRKQIKSENGAISAFALMSMAFFVIFIVSVFVFFSRRSQSQTETISILADKYNAKSETDIISTLISNEADIIPIYTLEQLKEIGTEKYITIAQESGKIYKFGYKEDLDVNDGSEDRAKYKLMQNWTLDELTAELKLIAESHTENLDGFSGLDVNQAKGVYIVNFPTVQKGELLVQKKILEYSEAKGKYYNDKETFLYEITVSNIGSVDIKNIEVKDVMKKISQIDGSEVFEDIPVYLNKNGELSVSNKLTTTFDLETQIQEDGSIEIKENVTYKTLYALYTTKRSEIDTKSDLINTVEVRGEHDGLVIRSVCESEKIIFTESPTYIKDGLVVWYDGKDNTATYPVDNERDYKHNQYETTWKDKTTTKTNASIKGKTTTDDAGNKIGNYYRWKSSKYLNLYGKKEANNSINTLENRAYLIFNNNSNNELDNIIGDLGRIANTSKGKDYKFSFQIVFELKNNDVYGCIYAFGRRCDSNFCTYVKTNSSGKIILGSDDKAVTIDGLGKLEKNKRYILTMNFFYEYVIATSENKNLRYHLTYDANLKNLTDSKETSAVGTLEYFTYIATYKPSTETSTNLRIGFNYNVIGNCFSATSDKYRSDDNFILKMNVYSFRLYNRQLTADEIKNNTTVDMNRFFK